MFGGSVAGGSNVQIIQIGGHFGMEIGGSSVALLGGSVAGGSFALPGGSVAGGSFALFPSFGFLVGSGVVLISQFGGANPGAHSAPWYYLSIEQPESKYLTCFQFR